MSGAASILFLLALGALAVPVIKSLRRRRAEQRLRDNPPEMVRMLTKLPGEADKSNIKAARFWDRMGHILPQDPKMLATNENVIHAAYIGTGAGVGKATKIRFCVWCHPSLSDRVQLALGECYEGELEITELKLKDDPLWNWLEKHKARQAWEERQASSQSDEDGDDDEDYEDDE